MRTFVGLALEPVLARQLAEAVKPSLGPAFRPPAAEEIHLTLVFLGEIDPERVEPLARALRIALREQPAPRLRLHGTGAFPGASRARVLWIGVTESGAGEVLARLQHRAEEACREAGALLRPGEAWHPHVTVARPRDRSGAPAPQAFRDLALDIPWTPRTVLLLESRPGERGPDRFPIRASIELSAESL